MSIRKTSARKVTEMNGVTRGEKNLFKNTSGTNSAGKYKILCIMKNVNFLRFFYNNIISTFRRTRSRRNIIFGILLKV